MKIMLPDDVNKINGMTPAIKAEIENAIKKLQREYDVQLDEIGVDRLGKGDIFMAGPFLNDDGRVRFGLVLNKDIDYNRVKKRITANLAGVHKTVLG